MIRINLLPHREIRRRQQQKEFFVMLGSVAGLGVAVWFAVHSYLSGQIEEQQGRNTYLESEIAALDKQIDQIKKLKEQTQALLQRKKIVESLQANRSETVYLLDQLVRQLPDGIYLKGISQKGNKVTINGYAQSNARVSTFMRNLESSAYLEKPALVEIKAITERNARLSEFSLVVSTTRTTDDPAAVGKVAPKPVAATATPVPVATSQLVAPVSSTAATAGNATPTAGSASAGGTTANAGAGAAEPRVGASTTRPAAGTRPDNQK
jgi:type IV pilus assembly protein PilN